ncbi:MAG: hypothetical protein IMZ69_00245 [Spirochaetes bacterium]|nr:hypothetical protein [Spirochaetota bacterium]
MIDLIAKALARAHDVLVGLGRDGRTEVSDERTVDISTVGDRAVSDALIEFFRTARLPALIMSEESGLVELSSHPELVLVFDDLDGTDNFYRGDGLLPYCSVIAVLEGASPRFADTLCSGVIEHRTGALWLAERGKGATFNGVPARASSRQHVDRRTLIAVDHYGSYSAMDQMAALHATGWIKDFGSSALHLAGVSSGMFDAYVTSAQKGPEIAAGYLLITEAGGNVTGLSGKSIKNDAYDFNATYEIAACANMDLGRAVLGLLSRSE